MTDTLQRLKDQFDVTLYVEVERVNQAFFGHLSRAKFLRKIDRLEIPIPTFTFDDSRKSQRYFRLEDLAEFLDQREKRIRYEHEKMLEILKYICNLVCLGAIGSLIVLHTVSSS